MKVVGLITEYNPFHNGHKYHIEEAKRMTGADYVIAVMSGDFVQRGTPAVIDKYSRTEMALQNGVDLVLELPVCYATGSAEFFAHGAVSLFDQLGIVDNLCFGSECGDLDPLKEAARFLTETPAAYDDWLQAFLKDGLTYPAARWKALCHSLPVMEDKYAQSLEKVLTEPNNILGIEYMKAIRKLNSKIIPLTLQRISASYHDIGLSGDPSLREASNPDKYCSLADHLSFTKNAPEADSIGDNSIISSATAIRKAINDTYSSDFADDYLSKIAPSVPDDVYQLLKDNYQKTYPITEEDFSSIIKYKLLAEEKAGLAEYMDITGDLADRMKKLADQNCSLSELIGLIKSKNVTLTRVNRALIHLLLNIRTDALKEYNRQGYCQYARVLGIKKESTGLLKKIEAAAKIPVITKVSKADLQLNELGLRMLSEDIFAAHLYRQVVYEKYKTPMPNEYKHGICIL